MNTSKLFNPFSLLHDSPSRLLLHFSSPPRWISKFAPFAFSLLLPWFASRNKWQKAEGIQQLFGLTVDSMDTSPKKTLPKSIRLSIKLLKGHQSTKVMVHSQNTLQSMSSRIPAYAAASEPSNHHLLWPLEPRTSLVVVSGAHCISLCLSSMTIPPIVNGWNGLSLTPFHQTLTM